MEFSGSLLKDASALFDVAKVLSDLDESDLFVACEVGAVNSGVSAFPIVALAVSAVEGEAYLLAGLGEVCFKLAAGDLTVVILKFQAVSKCKCVHVRSSVMCFVFLSVVYISL